MRFGCCHNGGRFSPQIHFGVPCEGTFLDMKKSLNPARREGWRLWSSSWTLVICASWHWSSLRWSNYFVIVNIKRSEPPSPKDSAQLLWVILRANRSSAALFLFLIINAFNVLSSAKSGNVAGFRWKKKQGWVTRWARLRHLVEKYRNNLILRWRAGKEVL